jgi:hypothetical protein
MSHSGCATNALTKLVEDDLAFLARNTLCDLHEPELHARAELVEPYGTLAPLFVIPADVVAGERDRLGIVLARRARRVRRGTLVPVRGACTRESKHVVRNVLFAAQVDDAACTGTRNAALARGLGLGCAGAGALEYAPHTFRHARCADGDGKVTELDSTLVGVVCNQNDPSSGGESEGLRGEGREERLEGLHKKREVWRCVGSGWWKRSQYELWYVIR